MHIIKITPRSFKIILTKDELIRGKDDISDISDDMFRHIIDEANRLYNNPFTGGTIDAEFFASKDGGAELFLTKGPDKTENAVYLFKTDSSDILISLCKHLKSKGFTYASRLYFHDDIYKLAISPTDKNNLFSHLLSEYGEAKKISPLQKWILDEHARIIISDHAVNILSENQ